MSMVVGQITSLILSFVKQRTEKTLLAGFLQLEINYEY